MMKTKLSFKNKYEIISNKSTNDIINEDIIRVIWFVLNLLLSYFICNQIVTDSIISIIKINIIRNNKNDALGCTILQL